MLIVCFIDLDEGVEGLLLVVLGDDFRQQGVLALSQLNKGTDTMDVGVDLDVQDVILSWEVYKDRSSQPVRNNI